MTAFLFPSNLIEPRVVIDYYFIKRFTYPHRSMIMEPLLLVSAFLLLFLVSIIYVRLDFSITKDETAESKMKVQ